MEDKALLQLLFDRDRTYLTFLQSGTLVTITAPRNALDGGCLESFSLISIDSL